MMPRAKQRESALTDLGIPLTLAPMEALLVAELPKEPGWQFEPKWDGFRCLAFRAKGEVEIKAKSGKSLSRFFPEVLGNLRAPSTQQFVLDGELVVPVGGNLCFDALCRTYPAVSPVSRNKRLLQSVDDDLPGEVVSLRDFIKGQRKLALCHALPNSDSSD